MEPIDLSGIDIDNVIIATTQLIFCGQGGVILSELFRMLTSSEKLVRFNRRAIFPSLLIAVCISYFRIPYILELLPNVEIGILFLFSLNIIVLGVVLGFAGIALGYYVYDKFLDIRNKFKN